MKRFLLSLLLTFSSIFYTCPLQATELTENLQDVSVTVLTSRGSGSGVIKIRDGETYVWTAGHVVSSCRHTRKILDEKGQSKTIVYFDTVKVVKYIIENGEIVGNISSDAEIIRYSSPQFGEDLAVLKLKMKHFGSNSVKFYLEEDIIPNGTELYHVGSLLGPFGSCSLTTGILSQQGRILYGKIFDQTSCTAAPGSSGGGVFLKSDGRYVGMLVRAAGETFNLIVPIRRMVDWAKRNDIEWAINDDVKVSSDANHYIENVEESDSLIELPTSVTPPDQKDEESKDGSKDDSKPKIDSPDKNTPKN